CCVYFFFQAEDGIRDFHVTGVQTCALPIWSEARLNRVAPTPTTVARSAMPVPRVGASRAETPPAGDGARSIPGGRRVLLPAVRCRPPGRRPVRTPAPGPALPPEGNTGTRSSATVETDSV